MIGLQDRDSGRGVGVHALPERALARRAAPAGRARAARRADTANEVTSGIPSAALTPAGMGLSPHPEASATSCSYSHAPTYKAMSRSRVPGFAATDGCGRFAHACSIRHIVVTMRRSGLSVPLIVLTLLALGVDRHDRVGEDPPAVARAGLPGGTDVDAGDRRRCTTARTRCAGWPADGRGAAQRRGAEGMSEGNEVESASAAPEPGIPDAGAAEQTAFGPRPAIPPAVSFDNGLNGGSTSDNNIGAGPDSIVVMRNSQFKVMSKTGDTLFGPVNNNTHLRGHERGPAGRAHRLHDRRRLLPAQLRRRRSRSRSRAGRTTPRRASRPRCRAATSSSRSRSPASPAPLVRPRVRRRRLRPVRARHQPHRGRDPRRAERRRARSRPSRLPRRLATRSATAARARSRSSRARTTRRPGIQNALQGGNEVQTITFSELQRRQRRQHVPDADRRQDDRGRWGSRPRSATPRRSPTRT